MGDRVQSPWPQPQRPSWGDNGRAHGMMGMMRVCRRAEWIFPPEAYGCVAGRTWWLRVPDWRVS